MDLSEKEIKRCKVRIEEDERCKSQGKDIAGRGLGGG